MGRLLDLVAQLFPLHMERGTRVSGGEVGFPGQIASLSLAMTRTRPYPGAASSLSSIAENGTMRLRPARFAA